MKQVRQELLLISIVCEERDGTLVPVPYEGSNIEGKEPQGKWRSDHEVWKVLGMKYLEVNQCRYISKGRSRSVRTDSHLLEDVRPCTLILAGIERTAQFSLIFFARFS